MHPKQFNPFVLLRRLPDSTLSKYLQTIPPPPRKTRKSPDKQSCYFCKLEFKGNTKAHVHMCAHTGERAHKCPLCNKNFHYFTKKNQHLISVHKSDGFYKCPHCPYKYLTAQLLAPHLNMHRGQRPFKCSICPATYRHKIFLSIHVKTKHGPEPERKVKCPRCPRQMAPQLVKRHVKMVHDNERPHLCAFCPKWFQARHTLMSHMRGVHLREKDLRKCPHPKCKLIFESRPQALKHALKCPLRELKEHKVEAPPVKYHCDLCPKVFRSKGSAKRHLETGHLESKMYPCQAPGCGKSYTRQCSLKRHMQNHNDKETGTTYSCKKCHRTLTCRTSFQQHLRQHEKGPKQRLTCYFCKLSFSATGPLTEHTRIHTGEIPCKCPTPGCTKAFRTRSQLLAHIQRHHGHGPSNTSRTSRTCHNSGCGLVFLTEHSLVNHSVKCEFLDLSKIRHKCKMCSEIFARRHELEMHIAKIHTGEIPYKCERAGCGKIFVREGDFNGHTRAHFSTFPCGKCPKVYKNLGSLRNHLRTVHGNWAGFPCYFCGKLLQRWATLRDHLLGHTREKPFKCPQCPRHFNTWWVLVYHLKKIH